MRFRKSLERCRMTESEEMSPSEMKAKQAVDNVILALDKAAKACYIVSQDEVYSDIDWGKLGSYCKKAQIDLIRSEYKKFFKR